MTINEYNGVQKHILWLRQFENRKVRKFLIEGLMKWKG